MNKLHLNLFPENQFFMMLRRCCDAGWCGAGVTLKDTIE
jgi:hypothetical protein